MQGNVSVLSPGLWGLVDFSSRSKLPLTDRGTRLHRGRIRIWSKGIYSLIREGATSFAAKQNKFPQAQTWSGGKWEHIQIWDSGLDGSLVCIHPCTLPDDLFHKPPDSREAEEPASIPPGNS